MAAVGAERVVVVAHRGRDPGGDGLLADAEVGRAADEALEEQLLGADLEQAGTPTIVRYIRSWVARSMSGAVVAIGSRS